MTFAFCLCAAGACVNRPKCMHTATWCRRLYRRGVPQHVLYTFMKIKYFFHTHGLWIIHEWPPYVTFKIRFSHSTCIRQSVLCPWVSATYFWSEKFCNSLWYEATELFCLRKLFSTEGNKHGEMLTYANWNACISICPQRIVGFINWTNRTSLSRNITLIKTTNTNASIKGRGISSKCHTWMRAEGPVTPLSLPFSILPLWELVPSRQQMQAGHWPGGDILIRSWYDSDWT